MDYTKKQYELMDRLSVGFLQSELTEDEYAVLRYLDDQGIAQARTDIQDGYWTLTQAGHRVLEQFKNKAKHKAKEKAEQKTDKRSDRIFQIFLAFLSAVIGAIIGNLDRLVAWLAEIEK